MASIMTVSCTFALINTLLQRGVKCAWSSTNRFNGFDRVLKTVETVSAILRSFVTLLKQGANERRSHSQSLHA